jgi:hypothetical protein
VKTDESARWLVSPGVRSTHAKDGVVLLDIKKGLCYSLNAVAARVWLTIEASPEGILVAGIVDVLETHFHVSREDLERDAAECLDKLHRMGLVQRDRSTMSSKAVTGIT